MTPSKPAAHVDVIIVGAGLSGIGAAYHLQKSCPGKSRSILEGREASGGTWDLFRYPGIRSDSDMYTLGYDFKPWVGVKAITDGPFINQLPAGSQLPVLTIATGQTIDSMYLGFYSDILPSNKITDYLLRVVQPMS